MKHASLASECNRPALVAAVCALVLAPTGTAHPAARYFVRGDTNVDGRVNISDPIHLLNLLFVGNVDPPLAVDASGNVHVTGRIDHLFLCTEEDRLDDDAHPGDYGTVKYDAAGNLLWLARYEGADRFSSAFARAIALDAAGNVYVTGADDHFFECDIELEPTEDDYATLKYSPMGEELWLATYDGPEDLDDGAADIAVDDQGNVYVTGQAGSTLFNGGGDIATIRYAPK